MKALVLLGFFSFLISAACFAQVVEPITMEKKGLKRTYIQNSETLDSKQLGSILKANEASAGAYKASRAYSVGGARYSSHWNRRHWSGFLQYPSGSPGHE
jgi:hypothetical protein